MPDENMISEAYWLKIKDSHSLKTPALLPGRQPWTLLLPAETSAQDIAKAGKHWGNFQNRGVKLVTPK